MHMEDVTTGKYSRNTGFQALIYHRTAGHRMKLNTKFIRKFTRRNMASAKP